jgi:hypothetical protein
LLVFRLIRNNYLISLSEHVGGDIEPSIQRIAYIELIRHKSTTILRSPRTAVPVATGVLPTVLKKVRVLLKLICPPLPTAAY